MSRKTNGTYTYRIDNRLYIFRRKSDGTFRVNWIFSGFKPGART